MEENRINTYPVWGAKEVSKETFRPLAIWSSTVISVAKILSVFHFSEKVMPGNKKKKFKINIHISHVQKYLAPIHRKVNLNKIKEQKSTFLYIFSKVIHQEKWYESTEKKII